jgi:hypothetical protein
MTYTLGDKQFIGSREEIYRVPMSMILLMVIFLVTQVMRHTLHKGM